jgi:hypothetical protein
VRAKVPTSSPRRRCWPSRCITRVYQVYMAPPVGGAVAKCTNCCHSVITRLANQASSASFRSASLRARWIRWARQVSRVCPHWQYTP